jgi:DnaJ-domain-containing protein 1
MRDYVKRYKRIGNLDVYDDLSYNFLFNFEKEVFNFWFRILKSKDLYETLGVSKEATESDIRKAYKKLVFHIHPHKKKLMSWGHGSI